MTIGYGKTDSVAALKNRAATDPVPLVQDLKILIPAQKPQPTGDPLRKRREQRPRRTGETNVGNATERDPDRRIDEYA
ncbi:MAG: hypothetical protein FGM62_06675 [Methylobacterium sp.]|nr:hypothetical protein [Methylobacterium sp.]